MKKIILLSIQFLLTGMGYSQNLMLNGSFESHSQRFYGYFHYHEVRCGLFCHTFDPDVSSWWSDDFGFSLPACLQSSNSPAGSYYAQLRSRKDDNINQGTYYTRISVDNISSWAQEIIGSTTFQSGHKYKLSFWYKTSSSTPLTNYYIYLAKGHKLNVEQEFPFHGPTGADQRVYGGTNVTNTSWQYNEIEFTANADYPSIYIFPLQNSYSESNLELDDLVLIDCANIPYDYNSSSQISGQVNYYAQNTISLTSNFNVAEGASFSAEIVKICSNSYREGLEENDNIFSPSDILTIYPNPGNGIFNLVAKVEFKELCIYNFLGQRIGKIDCIPSVSNYTFDLSGFPSGIYTLSMVNKGKIVSKKIILNK